MVIYLVVIIVFLLIIIFLQKRRLRIAKNMEYLLKSDIKSLEWVIQYWKDKHYNND